MTHAEMNELYELYALGALETDAYSEIRGHLSDGCEYCTDHVRDAVYAAAMLSSLAEAVSPPPEVRARLLAGIDRRRLPSAAVIPPVTTQETVRAAKSKGWWNFAVPTLATTSLALLAFSVWSADQVKEMRTDLSKVAGERDQLRTALEILSRSQTRAVQFGESDNVAHGRVLVNRAGGFVFVGSDLPAIASDRTFELWLVPPKGAPQSVGLVRASAAGDIVHISQTPVDPKQFAAVAVSVEPLGGSPAPTTKPFLIVPLG